MATHRTGHHFGRYNVAPLVKTTAVLLGLSAILYVVVATVEHVLPNSRAAAGFAPESPSVNPGSATNALDPRSATGKSQMFSPPAETRERTDGPRECRLDAGIDSACTFN
jgi:hypothetical protein